jgi:hypothetical protein
MKSREFVAGLRGVIACSVVGREQRSMAPLVGSLQGRSAAISRQPRLWTSASQNAYWPPPTR